jgi:RHS repeat-associated protein
MQTGWDFFAQKKQIGRSMTDKNNLDIKTHESKALTLSATSSSGPGFSNAPTYSALGYEIDPRTGTLQASISPPTFFGALGSSITPSIAYSHQAISAGKSLFGLPLGWSYAYSYIAASQVFINGQAAYYIDDQYDSGLRYYNLKNIVFTSKSGTFPYDPNLQYHNTLQFISGETQYFDSYGRLIGIADRWGNHAIFYYTRDGDVYNSKLSRIVGFSGQTITFTYSGKNIAIAYPSGGKNDIAFTYQVDSNSYLTGYLNPIGQQFSIVNKGGLVRNDLISQIHYPNGMSVTYEYTAIRYYADASRTQFYRIDCVAAARQTYVDSAGNSQTRVVSYQYDPNGDAHNYTGYPTYSMGKYADSLLESNDDNYRYVTKVDDGVLVTEHQYNRLHLELITKTFTKDAKPVLIKQVTNTFASETGGQYFPPYYQLKLIPNYQTPIAVTTDIYNDAGKKLSNRIESDFDNYGSPTEIRSYSSTTENTAATLLNKVHTTYDYGHYGQVIQKDTYDCTDATVIRRVLSSLTADSKNIATSTDGFVIAVNGTETFHPDKQLSYRYNTSGKIVYEKLAWCDGKEHALESTETFTSYDLHNPVLAITTTNTQGMASVVAVDTITGWTISKTNALKETTSYRYDNIGRTLTSTDPLGVVTQWVFEDAINKATTKYANGYHTSIYNNGYGDTVKTTDNAGNDGKERTLTANTYNNNGQLVWTEGILGIDSRIVYTYDSRNQLVTATDALGNVNRYQYDSVAQVKTEFFNDIKTSSVTKDNTILKEVTYASQTPFEEALSTSFSNSYSNIIKSIVGNPSSASTWLSTSFEYDVNNQVSSYSMTGNDAIVARHDISRDLFSNTTLRSVLVNAPETDSTSTTSDLFFYNNLNQLVSDTNPLGQKYSYTYNALGSVASYIDYAGTVFTCSYSTNNQLASIAWMEGAVQYRKQYTYDPLTYQVVQIELFSQESSKGRITYRYGLDGAIASLTYPDGRQILYTYDNTTGLLHQFTDAIGKTTQYSYDSHGRLTQQQIIGTDYHLDIAYYSKDEAAASSGKIKSIKLSNGLLSSFTYDGMGSVAQTIITDTSASGGNRIVLNTQYAYDQSTRNIMTVQSASPAFPQDARLNYVSHYRYNSLNQITTESRTVLNGTATETRYQYDAAGNVIQEDVSTGTAAHSTSYAYDQDNKLLRIDAATGTRILAYDVNGNLVDNGLGCTYRYNAQNRLVAYSDSKNNLVAEYDYYPDGMRASKKINGGVAIQFYYDYSQNPNIVNEIQGERSSHYLMMGSQRYIRLVNSATGTVPEYCIDSFRDVIAIVDASGALDASYGFDPYGQDHELIHIDADISINPFRYTAEYTDLESSLIYLRARYYAPDLKRFMSRDTSALINRYGYANGNPVMNSDPSGHMGIGWVIGATIAGIAVGLVTGGMGAAVLGTGFGASLVVGAVAGVAGTAASNGITEWGRHASGEAGLSAKDWGVSLLAGAASGVVGAGIGGSVGRATMRVAMKAGWSAARVTAAGVLSSSASGGFSGSVASAGITAGFDQQPFFSSEVWENIGISTAVGMGAGVMAAGAHFGAGRLNTTPVEMKASEIDFYGEVRSGNRILDLNPSERNEWANGALDPALLTGGQDTVIVHGHPRFSFPEDFSGRNRYASARTTAKFLDGKLNGRTDTIRLISCYAGRRIGVDNMAQTIANSLNRSVEAYSVAISLTEVVQGKAIPTTYDAK